MCMYKDRIQAGHALADLLARYESQKAVVVDDGLATGYTALAAIDYVRKRRPKKVVMAVPVASKNAEMLVKSKVDEYICPLTSNRPWFAVASFYERFSDLTDEEVLNCMKKYELVVEGW